jgi:hypothetical protein
MAPSAAAPVRLGGASPITTTLTPSSPPARAQAPARPVPLARTRVGYTSELYGVSTARMEFVPTSRSTMSAWSTYGWSPTRRPSATKAKSVAEVSRTTPIIVRLLLQKP